MLRFKKKETFIVCFLIVITICNVIFANLKSFVDRRMVQYPDPLDDDSTVIILSSLIPTHPSVFMINKTITSIRKMIIGVKNPKIIITIDGIPINKITDENIGRLHDYTNELRRLFQKDLSVMLLPHIKNLHINNSIKNALNFIETKYIYIVQHDFEFIRTVNHTEIVFEMEKYPEKIQIVRFDKGVGRGQLYNQQKKLKKKGCDVDHNEKFVLSRWSDNNHFTTKKYYEKALEIMGGSNRPPEAFFMANSDKLDCFFGNQWLYDYKSGDPILKHLDGRLTENFNETMYH